MSLAEVFERAVGGAGSVAFKAYDGSTAGPADPVATLHVRTPLALRYVIHSPGDLGLARAYVTGHLEVEGDVYQALRELTQARIGDLSWGQRKAVLDAAGGVRSLLERPPVPPEEHVKPKVLRRHSKQRDAEAISHHYDVSNRFYSWVLGPSMAYTCACYPKAEASLEEAQWEKFDLVARKLGLTEGQRLLDVGCGWGSMVIHAAKEYGVKAIGVTLSQQQAEFGQQRIREEGLEKLAEVRFMDYRDVTETDFDAVSSIGLTEHIGAKNLPSYFSFLASRLRPEGRLLNHCITRHDNKSTSFAGGFTDRYVFPDGELTGSGRITTEIQDAGFEVLHTENFRHHYAMTLRDWCRNLVEHWDAAVAEVGMPKAKVWGLYMAASRVAFEQNNLQLHHVLAAKVDASGDDSLPLRPWWRA